MFFFKMCSETMADERAYCDPGFGFECFAWPGFNPPCGLVNMFFFLAFFSNCENETFYFIYFQKADGTPDIGELTIDVIDEEGIKSTETISKACLKYNCFFYLYFLFLNLFVSKYSMSDWSNYKCDRNGCRRNTMFADVKNNIYIYSISINLYKYWKRISII